MEEFFHGTGFFPTDGGGCCLVGQVKLLVLRCDAGGCLLIDSGVQLVRFGFLPYCDGVGLLFLLPAAVASGLVEWILGLLDLVLLLLEMCAGVSWLRWISSIVEERGDDAGSSRLMLTNRESLVVFQRLESVFRFGSGSLVVLANSGKESAAQS